MVGTMSQAASAAYYLHSQRSFRHPTEYYTAGEEPDGVWFNPNDLLGLTDAKNIDNRSFHRLYNGFDPETGDKLTKNAGSDKRSAGLDITFSADKSVSALWAIADTPLRTKLEEAHNTASRMALQQIFLKECSYTRTRVGGADGDIQVIPAKMLGAIFQHGTSRAGDPHLHTHCVLFNAVQTDQDGVWRALHQKPLYLWIKAAGACYRAYLASNLAELGIKMERYGKENVYVRIQNMPQDLQQEWSKRQTTIVDAAAEMGFETGDNSKLAQMLRVQTRQSKRGDQDPEQRQARWRDECESRYQCASLIAAAFGDKQDVTPEHVRQWAEQLDNLPHALTRLQALFRTPDLAEAICNLHDTDKLGTFHPETIQSAIDRIIRNPQLVALDREARTAESIAGLSHTVPLSTRHTLQMETETRDLAHTLSQRDAFALPAQDIQDKLQELREEDYPLSDEQTSAIEYVAGRSGAVSIIEGAAGSGKDHNHSPHRRSLQEARLQHPRHCDALASRSPARKRMRHPTPLSRTAAHYGGPRQAPSRRQIHHHRGRGRPASDTTHPPNPSSSPRKTAPRSYSLATPNSSSRSRPDPASALSPTSWEATASTPSDGSSPTPKTCCATFTASTPNRQ